MEVIALALAVALVAAAVLFAARPFLRDPAGDEEGPAEPGDEERLALLVARDRALAALQELEFDHRTGKVSDEDYRAALGPLRRRVADALRALESEPAAERERPKADVRG